VGDPPFTPIKGGGHRYYPPIPPPTEGSRWVGGPPLPTPLGWGGTGATPPFLPH